MLQMKKSNYTMFFLSESLRFSKQKFIYFNHLQLKYVKLKGRARDHGAFKRVELLEVELRDRNLVFLLVANKGKKKEKDRARSRIRPMGEAVVISCQA